MKIQREGEHFRFDLLKGEQPLLWELLKLYPCISGASTRKGISRPDSNAQLLEEALAEQRAENKRQLNQFLADERRLTHSSEGVEFTLSGSELEWFLQILNDIRVGSWIELGAPEEKFELRLLDEKNAPHFWAMEMAGHFEMKVLAALSE